MTIGIDALAISRPSPLPRHGGPRARARRRSREVHARARCARDGGRRARRRHGRARGARRPPRAHRRAIASSSACSSSAPRPASITARPVASFVHGLLELPRTMRVYDTQHACYGGTAGLMAAVEWIASGAGDGRSALVICSDIARYGVGTAGEPTQGAGAVAMIVSRGSVAARDRRRASRAPRAHTSTTSGARSAGARRRSTVTTACSATSMRSRSRTAAGARATRGATPRSSRASATTCRSARWRRRRTRTSATRRSFVTTRGARTSRSRSARASATSIRARSTSRSPACSTPRPRALADARIGLFSYGSGCTSEFFSGTVSPRAADAIASARIADVLAARERISVADYERIMGMTPHSATCAGSRSSASKTIGAGTNAALPIAPDDQAWSRDLDAGPGRRRLPRRRRRGVPALASARPRAARGDDRRASARARIDVRPRCRRARISGCRMSAATTSRARCANARAGSCSSRL